MPVAYLILAHDGNEQLRLLVDTLLEDPRARVVIHLDRKSRRVGWLGDAGDPRVSVIRTVAVNWAGYSVVRATMALLRSAYAIEQVERFVMLSGSCFPLLDSTLLADAILAATEPVVAVWDELNRDSRVDRLGQRALTKFHPYDIAALNPQRGIVQRALWRVLGRINLRLPYRRRLPDRSFWKGSMFFMADRAFAGRLIAEQPRLERHLIHAHAPDEIFFATVFAHDRLARGLAIDRIAIDADRQGTHFIRRRRTRRGVLERMTTRVDERRLDPADIADAIASGAWFARKCDLATARAIKRAITRE